MKKKCEKCGKESESLEKFLCMLNGVYRSHLLCAGCRANMSRLAWAERGQSLVEVALALFYFIIFCFLVAGCLKLTGVGG